MSADDSGVSKTEEIELSSDTHTYSTHTIVCTPYYSRSSMVRTCRPITRVTLMVLVCSLMVLVCSPLVLVCSHVQADQARDYDGTIFEALRKHVYSAGLGATGDGAAVM